MHNVFYLIYRAFKFTVLLLLMVGFSAGVGCPQWCVGEIDELSEISPIDTPNK